MLNNFFPNWKKVSLIPIGVDVDDYKKNTSNYNIRNQWGISEDTRLIISVANLVSVKGIEILIGAFEKLSNIYPDWKLIIVGNDTTEYGLQLKKDLSKKQDLMEKIIFTGKQKNVREFLDISEIYVQPTLDKGRREGAPIAVLEAMANEKVVLGSNIPGIRDQLAPFPNHMFEPGNSDELKCLMNSFMLNDVNKNIMIGKKFMKHANNYYDLSIEKKHLEDYYQRLSNPN